MIASTSAAASTIHVAASRATGDASSDRSVRNLEQATQNADDKAQIDQLKATDRQVRSHEAAHLAAAGNLALGAASFSTVRGPDGRMYAVGGEVSIDVSPGRTPQETIAKGEQIQRAARAPVDPSAQDMRIAAQAAQMVAQARAELAAQPTAPGGAEGGSSQLQNALAGIEDSASAGAQINLFA
ncbi:MAG: hypothetical protein KDE64_03935 [Rhodocyclaceae bacterium]|nr:hypothetical protein [Rhodocyclaceae bacterium]